MTPRIIGIDLGTTFSLVSAMSAGTPVLFPNAVGEVLTPSAVSVTSDGAILVGAPARARATTHPGSTLLAFKRDMGTDRTWKIGSHVFTPQMLSALVLGELKKDAEAALGEAVEEAVITVPAYFGDQQRQATRDAGVLAGLKVERIINEPTAAALRYGLHERERELRAVVVDLGGGTFDVTVLEIVEGVIEIQATAGDARLGGEDFDQELAARIAADLRARHGYDISSPVSLARLRDACEQLKKRLSSASSARLVVPDLVVDDREVLVDLEVPRTTAEEAWAPLLSRLKVPLVRALRDAGLGPEQIDEVLLVGGATRMPSVTALVAQFFGRMPLRSLPADEAVAQGAAVQAALKERSAAVSDIVVTDIAPFSIGIATRARHGSAIIDGLFTPILERGTVIPASRTQRFTTVHDWQTAINIEVFQGEHPSCDKNQALGIFTFKSLASLPAGGASIDVRFTYDLNGILDVDVSEVDGRRSETFTLERTKGKLSDAALKDARERMKRLKVHPRELLPNVTALARAEALYVELTGPSRDSLHELIAAFKLTLERQVPAEIDACRALILSFIGSIRT